VEQAWVEELREFIAIPSVSADPAHREDVLRAADWLAQLIKRSGGEAEVELMKGGRPAAGTATARGPSADTSINGFEFHPPGYDPKKCKTCGTAKK